jgi:hypothetical protein
MDGLKFIGEVLVVVLYAVVISLPGIGVAYVGWKLSRGWHSVSAQTFFRAGSIAVATTPSVWGHAGILPAILMALVLSGREKLAGVVPILVVCIVAIPVIEETMIGSTLLVGFEAQITQFNTIITERRGPAN